MLLYHPDMEARILSFRILKKRPNGAPSPPRLEVPNPPPRWLDKGKHSRRQLQTNQPTKGTHHELRPENLCGTVTSGHPPLPLPMTIGKDIGHKEDTPVAIPLNSPAIFAHPQCVITVQPHVLTILYKESKFHLPVGHATNFPNLRLNETYGIPMCLRRLRWASVQIALL